MYKKTPAFVIVLALLWAVFYFFKTTIPRNKDTDARLDRATSQFIYTKHARCRMDCRHIDESEVKEILEKGTINYGKSQPTDKPDPKYAIEGITHDGQQVRIIFALSERGMVVITVIDLKEQWPCNCN